MGVGWYRRDQWALLREVAADRDKLGNSYEEWLAGAQQTLLRMSAEGVRARRVDVDVGALIRWCQAEARSVDAAARAEFVATLLRESHSGHGSLGGERR
jgi:hypothetical protein